MTSSLYSTKTRDNHSCFRTTWKSHISIFCKDCGFKTISFYHLYINQVTLIYLIYPLKLFLRPYLTRFFFSRSSIIFLTFTGFGLLHRFNLSFWLHDFHLRCIKLELTLRWSLLSDYCLTLAKNLMLLYLFLFYHPQLFFSKLVSQYKTPSHLH